jgi:hypothetical protein
LIEHYTSLQIRAVGNLRSWVVVSNQLMTPVATPVAGYNAKAINDILWTRILINSRSSRGMIFVGLHTSKHWADNIEMLRVCDATTPNSERTARREADCGAVNYTAIYPPRLELCRDWNEPQRCETTSRSM